MTQDDAAEAAYESMHGLYRPWKRLERAKKDGWVKAVQATAPAIEAPLLERLAEVEAEYDEATQGLAVELIDARREADAAEAKLAAFERALKSDAAIEAVLTYCAPDAPGAGTDSMRHKNAKAAIDALLQAAHHELKEKEDGS